MNSNDHGQMKALPAIGTEGRFSGFPATVVGHYYEMIEIRLPGGVACVSPSYFVAEAR